MQQSAGNVFAIFGIMEMTDNKHLDGISQIKWDMTLTIFVLGHKKCPHFFVTYKNTFQLKMENVYALSKIRKD